MRPECCLQARLDGVADAVIAGSSDDRGDRRVEGVRQSGEEVMLDLVEGLRQALLRRRIRFFDAVGELEGDGHDQARRHADRDIRGGDAHHG